MELAITLPVGNEKADKKIEISSVAFNREFNEHLVHQVVVACLASRRSGTKAQKTRSQVSGGGAKPFKQKGSGRARAGTIRSPLWRTGGKVFAAVPRDFSQKINKKMYRGAMQCILSELIRQNRLTVVEDLNIDKPKTKDFINLMKGFKFDEGLVVTGNFDPNLYLSARNLVNFEVRDVDSIDPVNLLKYPQVIMTVGAIRHFEGVLTNE